MATFQINARKGSLADCVEYVLREDKTCTDSELNQFTDRCQPGRQYIAALNAGIDTFAEDCQRTKEHWGKTGGTLYYHGSISFPKEDIISPEVALQVAKEVLQEHCGDRFEVLMAVHFDAPNLHVNFIINSVSFADGKKYEGNNKMLWQARHINDAVCEKHGLSTLKDPARKKDGKRTWRDLAKADIDSCLEYASDLPSLLGELQKMGYLLKDGKHYAISPPGYYSNGNRRFLRLDNMKDPAYTLEGIQRRLDAKNIASYGNVHKSQAVKIAKKIRRKRKLPRYMAVYYRYAYKLGLLKRKPPRVSAFRIARGQREAKDLSARIRYLHENHIHDETALLSRMNHLQAALTEKKKERKKLYNDTYRNGGKNDAQISALTEEINKLNQEYLLCSKVAILPSLERNDTAPHKEAEERREEKCMQNQKQQVWPSDLSARESVK